MPPTRVVLNGRFLAQTQTGVQRYATETVRAMDAVLAESPAVRDQLEFVLATPTSVAKNSIPLRHIRQIGVAGGEGHLWEQGALWWFSRGAYLVNFNYSGPLLKRHQMVTVHDATVRVMPTSFTRSYRLVHNLMVAVLGRTSRDMMTVSAFSREELRRWFRLSRGDILVGREGGEHAVVDVDAQSVLHRHGLQAGRYILGVGSIKPNKNFGLLGRAMRLLPHYPMPVAIAGARDIGIFNGSGALPDNFLLLGFVTDAELSALYRHAAWFVFPSLYEGFGLPAIEAMANGCPVLAARSSCIPEVCGDAALYFDPNDAGDLAQKLQQVVDDPTLRGILQARASRRLERYNWNANAQVLIQHLTERLLGSSSGTPASLGSEPARTVSVTASLNRKP